MLQPVSKILVINDERLVLRELIKGLNAAARTLDNPLGIVFTGVTTAQEALRAIENDGDIQAVVVDHTLYTISSERNNGSRTLQMSALNLVQNITRFRPELNVYILIAQEQEDEVVDALFTEAVDGYFYREERDYRGMYRILNAQIQEKARASRTNSSWIAWPLRSAYSVSPSARNFPCAPASTLSHSPSCPLTIPCGPQWTVRVE